jgi:hypothetical protein
LKVSLVPFVGRVITSFGCEFDPCLLNSDRKKLETLLQEESDPEDEADEQTLNLAEDDGGYKFYMYRPTYLGSHSERNRGRVGSGFGIYGNAR